VASFLSKLTDQFVIQSKLCVAFTINIPCCAFLFRKSARLFAVIDFHVVAHPAPTPPIPSLVTTARHKRFSIRYDGVFVTNLCDGTGRTIPELKRWANGECIRKEMFKTSSLELKTAERTENEEKGHKKRGTRMQTPRGQIISLMDGRRKDGRTERV